MSNPKKCKLCNNALSYNKRHSNIYCSHSCAAKVTNANRIRPLKIKPPSIIRRSKEQRLETNLIKFSLGLLRFRHILKKCLIATQGNKCDICQQSNSWHRKPLTMVLDHIDGDASNNFPSNLRLLCPNCNSQTSTFCGRNKGKGRQSRGMSKYS